MVSEKRRKKLFSVFLLVLGWTQGLMHTRQALYCSAVYLHPLHPCFHFIPRHAAFRPHTALSRRVQKVPELLYSVRAEMTPVE